jgi:alpha-ketoglutarate-dependent taurine dioxygenase
MTIQDPQPLKKRRWKIKPRPITSSQEDLVRFSFLNPDQPLPLVIEPNFKEVDLIGWVKNNRELLETELLEYGGVLFRGFSLSTQAHFEQFLQATSITLMHYMEGATPRTVLGDRIYTSTEFPPERTISIHNELCYVATWPMKIFFYCMRPSDSGGETPIGDVRKVFRRISPDIIDRFKEKGWMLLRNFGGGFGLPWQTSFHVSDKPALEEYFHHARISYEWREGDRLRTKQVRPAIAVHPKTGDPVWFNHIGFWHISSLEREIRELFLDELTEHGLPFNTYYGDGAPIENSVIDELRRAYDAETIAFPWRQGDLLMLDNMLTAHGRRPSTGTRRVLTAMGEPFTRTDF